MERNKLIPMVEFVKHIHSMTTSELCKAYPKVFKMPEWKGDKSEIVKDILAFDARKWVLAVDYAKFLSQPLTLGMFVPCDEEGNPLYKPNESEFTDETGFINNAFFIEMHDYNKAKERVMFEGFHIIGHDEDSIEIELETGNLWLLFEEDVVKVNIEDNHVAHVFTITPIPN